MNDMRRVARDPEPKLLTYEKPAAKPIRKRVFVIPAVLVIGLLAWGAYGHWQTNTQAAATQTGEIDFTPMVHLVDAKREDGPVRLELPGATEAFDSATMYARATGYISQRFVDIGSRVHTGDLLARISAPDLDAQLVQAEAQLAQTQAAILQAQASLRQAQSSSKLANVTNFRESTLANQGWETRQNADNSQANQTNGLAAVDTAQAGIAVANANFAAQQATVARYKQLTDYERVVAPFDGVVTARNVDVGDLVSTDSNTGTSLFTVTKDSVLRVSLYVPQSSAIGVRPGLAAQVTVPELPGRVFDAKVARSADALDPASRTMLTEVDVQNPEGTLRAGLYGTVRIDVPRDAPGVVIPANAILFNAGGLQVAVFENGHAALKTVSIYRDFGKTVELRQGLSGGEKVIVEPPADITDGAAVKVAPADDGGQGRKPAGGKQVADADSKT